MLQALCLSVPDAEVSAYAASDAFTDRMGAELQAIQFMLRNSRHKAYFQVQVMAVASILSLVSGSTVYLSCKKPSYPD